MAYVIAEPCIGTKDTLCVDVCPVDCIDPKKNGTYDDGRPGFDEVPQLYIDPVECIDCGACVPLCPVSTIFPIDDIPEKWRSVHRLLWFELAISFLTSAKRREVEPTTNQSPSNFNISSLDRHLGSAIVQREFIFRSIEKPWPANLNEVKIHDLSRGDQNHIEL